MKPNDDGLFPQAIEEGVAEIDPVGVLQALLRCAARKRSACMGPIPASVARPAGVFDKAAAPAGCRPRLRCSFLVPDSRKALRNEAVNGLPRRDR